MFETIRKISGLRINKSKSEGMWLGIKKSKRKCLIKWPPLIKLLGVCIGYHEDLRDENICRENMYGIKLKFNIWKQRDLTI